MQSRTDPNKKTVCFDLDAVQSFQESIYGGTLVVFKNGREMNVDIRYEAFSDAFSNMLKEPIVTISDNIDE